MKTLIYNTQLFCKVILITIASSSMLWAIDLPPNLTINKEVLLSNNKGLPSNLGIEGYSPVSYFEKNKAEMGLPQFSSEHKGKVYWFTSTKQIDTFKSNPDKYLPVFEAFCPYALALGREVAIDPTNFKIVAGQLLFFHRSSEMDALKAFNESANQDEILRRAKKKYLSLDF